MVVCQIPTISPSNPGVGDAIDKCITHLILHEVTTIVINIINVHVMCNLTSCQKVKHAIMMWVGQEGIKVFDFMHSRLIYTLQKQRWKFPATVV